MSEEKKQASRPKLSILICTVESRVKQFKALYDHIMIQIDDHSEVEVLVFSDNKEISIGAKRQMAIEEATGDYIVFVDDDDWVPNYYVGLILQNLGADAISIHIDCMKKGKPDGLAKASMKYDWADNVDGYKYVRNIYHKCPVRRELALQAGFKDMRFSEDRDYSLRLKPLIKSEKEIIPTMYYYRYKDEPFKQKYGFDKD